MTPEAALDLLHRALSWKPVPLMLAALWFAVPSWGLWTVAVATVSLTPLLVYVLGSMRRWGWLSAFGLMVALPVVGAPAFSHASMLSSYLWSMLPFFTTLLYGMALQGAVTEWHMQRQYALRWKGEAARAVSEPQSARTGR